MITGLILLLLIILSLIFGLVGAHYYKVKLQLNSFSTPSYVLGLVYQQFEGVDEKEGYVLVDIFTIGIIIAELEFSFYKMPTNFSA